jgi:hypothetical protein
MIEIIGSFNINPLEIENNLRKADFTYPKRIDAEQFSGFSKTPIIPALYDWTVKHMRPPNPDEGVYFILSNADDGTDVFDSRIICRAQKLYMDFCRDIHTLGLLQKCDLFGFVSYQKALDIRYNVDYIVRILLSDKQAGIQSAMRYNWNNDLWTKIKEGRKANREEVQWDGKIFWLKNDLIPHMNGPNKCWLFNDKHIIAIAEEIKHEYPSEVAAIQFELKL